MEGFSAGGNLALSASQLPGLKGTVKAIVAYYPVIDFSISPSIKLAFRPYKGGPKDRFGDASWWLDWGYIRVGEKQAPRIVESLLCEEVRLTAMDIHSWCTVGHVSVRGTKYDTWGSRARR
jgi:hypothetical protein